MPHLPTGPHPDLRRGRVADGPTACHWLPYAPAVSTWHHRGARTLDLTHVYDLESTTLGERLQVTVAEPPLAAGGTDALAT